jgi:hypothetical protein
VTLSLGLDLLIVVLLAAAIGAAVMVCRKHDQAQRHWRQLEAASERFLAATAGAEAHIRTLKLSAAELAQEAQRAETLIEDLRLLIERGGAIADRLEADVRAARAEQSRPRPAASPRPPVPPPGAPAAAPSSPPAAASALPPRSAAERALLDALGSSV